MPTPAVFENLLSRDSPGATDTMNELSNSAVAEAEISDPANSLRAVPNGAFALAGAAVASLLIAWLLVYFLIFLQRGPVG